MTDAVKVAIIMAIPGMMTAVMGIALFFRQGTTQKSVQTVETKVDGNLSAIRLELQQLNRALGQAEGRDEERKSQEEKTA